MSAFLTRQRTLNLALVMPLFLAACGTSEPASGDGGEAQSSASESASSSSDTQGSTEASEDGFADAFTDNSTGGESGDTGPNPNGPEIIDYDFCEIDGQATADINGFTSVGTYAGRYAWFGWLTCNGEALSPTLVVTETLDQLTEAVQINPDGDAIPRPSLEFSLFGACDPAGGWVGDGILNVYLRDSAGWQQARGQFSITQTHRMFDELDPTDPPYMVGTLNIMDEINGWELSGPFTAAYCGALSYALDCQ